MERKELSWKLFGTSFNNDVTINEAFEEAGLNFNVEKGALIRVPQSLIDEHKRGDITSFSFTDKDIIKSHKATFRNDTDTTLGVVGHGYGVVQNSKAFEFLNFIEECSGEKLKIETAGALGYGERVFVTAKLGANSYLSPNDAIENYVVFSNSHDGSGSVMCFFTPIRIICANSLNFAIRKCPNKLTFKHSKYVDTRINFEVEENRKRAFEVFSASVNFSKQFEENMLNLKAQKVDEPYINMFVGKMILSPAQYKLWEMANYNTDKVDEISTRSKNLMLSLRESIDSGVGQEYNRGTKVWLLNGITTYLHNDKTWKTPQDEFKSLMDGDGAKKVQKAYDLLMTA